MRQTHDYQKFQKLCLHLSALYQPLLDSMARQNQLDHLDKHVHPVISLDHLNQKSILPHVLFLVVLPLPHSLLMDYVQLQ